MKIRISTAIFAISLVLVLLSNTFTAQALDIKTEVEQELAISEEAAKEANIDLRAELNLPANFDPVVPTGPLGKLAYPFKKAARGVREAAAKTFQSEETYTKVVKKHAEEEMYEAVKTYEKNPKAAVNIMAQYQKRLDRAREAMDDLKYKNEQQARRLAEEFAKQHLLNAPKIMEQMRDDLVRQDPLAGTKMEELKKAVLKNLGQSIVSGAGDGSQAAEILGKAVRDQQHSAFSGFAHAEVLSETRDQLKAELPAQFQKSFDEAISGSLRFVEQEYRRVKANSEEERAGQFAKFVEQLPGSDINRVKMLEQFRAQAQLPPEAIGKMQEAKARVAEAIGERLQQIPDEKIREEMSRAFLEFKNPGVDDLKTLGEVKDLIPNKEIRKHIEAKHEQQVQKFLDRFGDDQNARAVTEEYDNLVKKVKSGEIVPDANFFKTTESLARRLSPEQQQFIRNMEEAGKQEMMERMKNDPAFAERFSTFNPADTQVFEKLKDEGRIFEEKFHEFEKQQVENYKHFLELRDRPEEVRDLQERFESEVPQATREKFEHEFKFDPEAEFQKHERLAGEKEQLYREKFEGIQKQYQEKHGREFPGQGQPFTNPGFFPPGVKPHCPEGYRAEGGDKCLPDEGLLDKRIREDRAARERGQPSPRALERGEPGEGFTPKPDFDQGELCRKKGGEFTGKTCNFSGPQPGPGRELNREARPAQPQGSGAGPGRFEGRALPEPELTLPHRQPTPSFTPALPQSSVHSEPILTPADGGAVRGLKTHSSIFSIFEPLIPWQTY